MGAKKMNHTDGEATKSITDASDGGGSKGMVGDSADDSGMGGSRSACDDVIKGGGGAAKICDITKVSSSLLNKSRNNEKSY